MSESASVPPLLAARGLCFTRDERPVFGPLDFDVAAGEALLVQGGNGAGKTTLLRVLAGLLEADGGTVEVGGAPVARAMRAGTMAYLGHLPGLKADLDAIENLDFLARLQGCRASQSADSGVLGTMNKLVGSWTNAANGFLGARKQAATRLQSDIADRLVTVENQFNNAYKRYLTQFTALQTLQSSMTSTSNMFTAMFSSDSNN